MAEADTVIAVRWIDRRVYDLKAIEA